MRISSIIIVFYACVATLGAEEPITPCPLKATAFYSYPSTNIGGRVNPGDKINISISIQNISTNLIVLSLGSYLSYHCVGKPVIVLSSHANEVTGDVTRYLAGGGQGGTRKLNSPWSYEEHADTRANTYAFIEPGKYLSLDIENIVSTDLGDYAFTTMEYGATIKANDSGNKYGLNAWTGTLEVTGCTVPLRNSKQENGQPTNAPYSSPAAGSNR